MMSQNGSANIRQSQRPVATPVAMVDALENRWLVANKRRVVVASAAPVEYCEPLRILSAPEWPGIGSMATSVDVLPIVAIDGMPASEYPRHVKPLIAYTLAELACERPHLATAARGADLVHLATIAVAVRAGTWAALGCAPTSSASVSNEAVRWSGRMRALVVRPAAIGDSTALWRQFLATFPGLPATVGDLTKALVGAAPILFLMGAALLLQAGEVYAMHYLEKELSAYLRSVLDTDTALVARLESRATWDTLNAAAIGGYSVSIIRQISTDSAFSTAASMRISPRDAPMLKLKLESIISSAPTSYRGIPVHVARKGTMPTNDDRDPMTCDDTESVADTEAGGMQIREDSPPGSGTSTPCNRAPPSLAPEARLAVERAYREIPRMTGGALSAARIPLAVETVKWE